LALALWLRSWLPHCARARQLDGATSAATRTHLPLRALLVTIAIMSVVAGIIAALMVTTTSSAPGPHRQR